VLYARGRAVAHAEWIELRGFQVRRLRSSLESFEVRAAAGISMMLGAIDSEHTGSAYPII
jgi:hypothetical protein